MIIVTIIFAISGNTVSQFHPYSSPEMSIASLGSSAQVCTLRRRSAVPYCSDQPILQIEWDFQARFMGCIYIYTHTHIHTYIHTCMHAYIHTYIPTYIYTYMCTHIYRYINMYTCI